MYGKKHDICKVGYYLWFQTSVGVLSAKNKGALLHKQQSEDLEFNKQVTGKKRRAS